MRFDGNGGASPNYEPNSFGGPNQDPAYETGVVKGLGITISKIAALEEKLVPAD